MMSTKWFRTSILMAIWSLYWETPSEAIDFDFVPRAHIENIIKKKGWFSSAVISKICSSAIPTGKWWLSPTETGHSSPPARLGPQLLTQILLLGNINRDKLRIWNSKNNISTGLKIEVKGDLDEKGNSNKTQKINVYKNIYLRYARYTIITTHLIKQWIKN